MPSFNREELLIEEAQNPGNRPFRFGKGFNTNITLKDGIWHELPEGRLWNIWIESTGAYSINLILNELYLPEGGTIHIFNTDKNVVYGPVTNLQNLSDGAKLLTDLVPGDRILLEIFEPADFRGMTKLGIIKVVHAYKDMFKTVSESGFGQSAGCNVDINCYPSWDKESDAVGMVLLASGEEWCSGSLLNNTAQNFRPYFLTAFHCIDTNGDRTLQSTETNASANWSFRFQYKVTQCDGASIGTYYSYPRSFFRAGWPYSDFALVELRMNPVGNPEFTWLGWDTISISPDTVTCIHHPQGDVMKISIDNESPITGTFNPTVYAWIVNDWDIGTIEPGSSGSPMFDQNKKVRGQTFAISEEEDPCDVSTAFGRFDMSWRGGGTSATQLRHWLDPCNLNPATTNTIRSPHIVGHEFLCTTSKTFSIQNIPDNVVQIAWSASPASLFTTTSGTGSTFNTAWTGTGGGNGTITATLTSNCSSFSIRTTTWVGLPQTPSGICCPTGEPICRGIQYYYQYGVNAPANGAETYYWDLQPPGIIMGANPRTTPLNFYYPSSTTPGYYSLAVKSENECGSSPYLILHDTLHVVDCGLKGFTFSIFPNPASEMLTVEILPDDGVELHDGVSTKIEVFDIHMMPKKNVAFAGNSTGIDVRDLPNGIYILKISIDEEKYTVTSSSETLQKELMGDKVYFEKVQIQH